MVSTPVIRKCFVTSVVVGGGGGGRGDVIFNITEGGLERIFFVLEGGTV